MFASQLTNSFKMTSTAGTVFDHTQSQMLKYVTNYIGRVQHYLSNRLRLEACIKMEDKGNTQIEKALYSLGRYSGISSSLNTEAFGVKFYGT